MAAGEPDQIDRQRAGCQRLKPRPHFDIGFQTAIRRVQFEPDRVHAADPDNVADIGPYRQNVIRTIALPGQFDG